MRRFAEAGPVARLDWAPPADAFAVLAWKLRGGFRRGMARMPPAPADFDVLAEGPCALRRLPLCQPAIAHGDVKACDTMVELLEVRYSHSLPRVRANDACCARAFRRRLQPLGDSIAQRAQEAIRSETPRARKADVFSFGHLLHCVANGWQPLQGGSAGAVALLAKGD